MPNCFQLTRKSEPEKGPVKLTQIDQEIADHLGVPCNPTIWCYYWYDIIGFKLALGKKHDEIKADLLEVRKTLVDAGDTEGVEFQDQLVRINDFLEANFTSDSWVEIGKR